MTVLLGTVIVESTALVEQKTLTTHFHLLLVESPLHRYSGTKISVFSENFDSDPSKVGILKLIKL